MVDVLKGKKLLILGATASEVTLVKRAQSFGIYVIVTDNHTDYINSPAKYVANEVWDVSWADIDKLEILCIENKIDGVTAGYSEFRVESMIKLCERLNLPSYINMEQLDITRDKIKFKNECRKYNLPVVNEYASPEDVNSYPVIVKPVDRAGSIGISIATNKEELKKSYEYAMSESVCKQVIIEDYIYDSDKVDFYYAIENGKIELISSCDTINASSNGFKRVVQSSWLYPERKLASALEKVDSSMRKMISGMGIKYGCIFFSGFVNKNLDFVFFECGFRLEGGHQYEYVYRRGYMNFMDIFIYHSLLGNTNGIERNLKLNDKLKCVTINLYAKKGIISDINGIEEIKEMQDCSLAMIRTHVGQKCEDDKAILLKIGMFSFCNESSIQLRKDVEKAYSLLSVQDENGNDMIYDRINPELIETWWD